MILRMASRRAGSRSSRLRVVLILPVLLIGALAATLALTVHDTAVMHSRQELTRASFGMPLPWLHQDLAKLSATSYPFQASYDSPLENPTSASLLPFLADTGIALVVLGCILLILWRFASVVIRRNEAWVKRRSDQIRSTRGANATLR
jgi:hypothetical protein